jgi:hypothetical protein
MIFTYRIGDSKGFQSLADRARISDAAILLSQRNWLCLLLSLRPANARGP